MFSWIEIKFIKLKICHFEAYFLVYIHLQCCIIITTNSNTFPSSTPFSTHKKQLHTSQFLIYQFLAAIKLFFISMNLRIRTFHIHGILQYVYDFHMKVNLLIYLSCIVSCEWFPALRTVFSKFNHIVACISTSFPFRTD